MPAHLEPVQTRVAALLGAGRQAAGPGLATAEAVAQPRRPSSFSVFDPDDSKRASETAARFAMIADAGGDNVLDAVLAEFERLSRTEDVELLRHALKLFMTHHPLGRQLRMPSLLSQMHLEAVVADAVTELGSKASPDEENQLNWFREDPLANEHHEHWHIVYNNFPSGFGGGFLWPGGELRQRHGELFFYMHQQMLARYDMERRSVGLRPVVAFADYRAPMTEGYDPGILSVGDTSYLARAPGVASHDSALIMRLERRRDRMFDAAESGVLRKGATFIELSGHAGSDLLGHANEPTQASADSDYYSHHGGGHLLIAQLSSPSGSDPGAGVMSNTATAIRDPMFWRWHRHIDDIHFTYQQALPSHNFSDAPSGIFLHDVALVRESGMPQGLGADDGDEWAKSAFGGDQFDAPITDGSRTFQHGGKTFSVATSSELRTEMRFGQFSIFGAGGQTVVLKYPYLWHEKFSYVIRARNKADKSKDVTVRIFLGPGDGNVGRDGRRNWVEMDKFKATLQAGENAVFLRPDTASSVIRRDPNAKDGVVDPANVTDIDGQMGDYDSGYCTCGWPHHLLLPRGNEQGEQFKLFVMLSDWFIDYVPETGSCGSMSFCGARNRYPDTRPMGYPFDRAFPGNTRSAADLAAAHDNMKVRDVAIKCASIAPKDAPA